MPIAVEIRTTCERCKDPLPLNAWATSVPCWACLHENPVSPEHWAQLLRGALEDAWTVEEGEGRTENLKVGKRSYEVRWSVVRKPKGPVRRRPSEMRQELFPGVVGLSGEETATPTSRDDIEFKCPQCAAALTIDGRSRQITCSYCQASTQLSDDAWRRIHPVHAQRPWVLVLEDDGVDVGGKAEREKPTAPKFTVWDATTGPDGLIYAAVEFDKPALVCLDPDLSIRWRTDVKKASFGFTRVGVVGDEVWWADATRHFLRRFARADGKDLGKLGGVEPLGAKVHHLDLKGASDVIGCPDGTAVVLVAHRIVRFDREGKGILTWPPATGVMGWLFGEKLKPLYQGPPDDEDDDSPVSTRGFFGLHDGIIDQLGSNRPTHAITLFTRGIAAPDGSLWLFDGTKVHRYAKDGKFRWTAVFPDCQQSLNARPGLDGDLNCYVVGLEDDGQRSVLFRVAPDGKVTRLTDQGVGRVNALAVTADGHLIVFGGDAGEVRIFDRDGKRERASASAVDADRVQAEEEEEEADDEE